MPSYSSHGIEDYVCDDCSISFRNRDYWEDHLSTCWECETDFCPDECHECTESEDYGVGIHDYGYKPRGGFRAMPYEIEPAYYVGFELEIGTERMNATPIYEWARANNVADLLYAKDDSSVEGFEIVSYPMTPAYFDSVDWSSFFAMLNREYETYDLNESSEHGLHVHVSRTAFKYTSQMARLSLLWTRNRETVWEIARRANSEWAQFNRYPVRTFLPFCRSGHQWEDDYTRPLECGCHYERRMTYYGRTVRNQVQDVARHGRYEVINQYPADTLEVRAFRSTRRVADFLASVHFVIASVDFVTMQPWHATARNTSIDTFREYVESHPTFSYDTRLVSALVS